MYQIDEKLMNTDLKELYDRAEPSMKEFETSKYIKKRLESMGLTYTEAFNTGLFGTLDVGAEKTIGIRADMDALPYAEDKSEYRHLCGHHANMTTVLTILETLVKVKDKLNVNVRYVFQPAEELISGSVEMIKEGCMEGVSEMYATHTAPDVDFGYAALVEGPTMAGSCHFDLLIKGMSTHAAMPHLGTDTVTAAAEYIMSCQTILTRKKSPILNGLISFGSINGGSAANILPGEVRLAGTFRYFDNSVKPLIEHGMRVRLKNLEDFYGVQGELNVHEGTPPVICDREIVQGLAKIAEEKNLPVTTHEKGMGGEDFSYYLEYAPGAFIWQGVRIGESSPPLHNKNYVVPEGATLPAARLLIEYILSK
jgi:amidohydrolase